jgi:hypothetical protein
LIFNWLLKWQNYKSIHLLEMNQNFAGTIYTGSWTPAPLGPVLQKEVPGLKYVARAREESQSLTAYGEKAIYQKGMYAELRPGADLESVNGQLAWGPGWPDKSGAKSADGVSVIQFSSFLQDWQPRLLWPGS